MSQRPYFLLALALLSAFIVSSRSQDFAPPAAGPGTGGTIPPSSIRANAPTSPTDPGTEGQIAMDDLWLYTYHAGLWKKSPRINL